MKPQRITISKDTINNAVKRNSHRCMIADGLQQCVKKARYIVVDLQSIKFTLPDKGVRRVYLTPPRAQKALLAFDKGENVKPFTITCSLGYETPIRSRSGKHKNHKKPLKQRGYRPKIMREFGLRTLSK